MSFPAACGEAAGDIWRLCFMDFVTLMADINDFVWGPGAGVPDPG